MPSHSHYYRFMVPETPWDGNYGVSGDSLNDPNIAINGTHRHDYFAYTHSNGYDQPHENRPPFYAVYFIMKIRS